MTMQRVFADKWKELDPAANVLLIPTIEEAINTARALTKEGPKVQALITGSLHLVGGALGILEGADAL
jgi:folylpolyglutamate synthase